MLTAYSTHTRVQCAPWLLLSPSLLSSFFLSLQYPRCIFTTLSLLSSPLTLTTKKMWYLSLWDWLISCAWWYPVPSLFSNQLKRVHVYFFCYSGFSLLFCHPVTNFRSFDASPLLLSSQVSLSCVTWLLWFMDGGLSKCSHATPTVYQTLAM